MEISRNVIKNNFFFCRRDNDIDKLLKEIWFGQTGSEQGANKENVSTAERRIQGFYNE